MHLTSNITAKNSTGEQVWAVTKYGYRSRHNYSLPPGRGRRLSWIRGCPPKTPRRTRCLVPALRGLGLKV